MFELYYLYKLGIRSKAHMNSFIKGTQGFKRLFNRSFIHSFNLNLKSDIYQVQVQVQHKQQETQIKMLIKKKKVRAKIRKY